MPVLPCEPVIASTTTSGSRSTTWRARRPSAAVTSSTTTVGRSVGRLAEGGDRSGRAGRLREVVAVDPLAGDRDEQPARLGGAGVEEGAAADDGLAVRDTADHVGDLGQGHLDHRGVPIARDLLRRDDPVVEGVHDAVDLLAALVTLAGDQQHVARLGTAYGLPDREPAVPHLEHLGPTGAGAVEHGGADRRGVLGAGVVVGDDQDVGQPRADLAHQRALDRVAVAARPDHHDHLALRQRAQRGEDGLEGVGLVGVVDDDGVVLPLHDRLEAARHAVDPGDPLGDHPRVEARHRGGRDRGERVGDVELAREVDRGHQLDVGPLDREGGAGGREVDVDGSPVGVPPLGGVRRHRDRGDVEEPATELVVDVGEPDPCALGGEEARLGGEVVVDVGVEVEVVAAEVEEGRHVEDDAVDPAEDQRVAGDLHRAGVDAPLRHHGEEAVQVGRLGGGELGLHVLPRDPGADGADHGRGQPGGGEPLLEEAGGRGLALGAGDADDAQPGGRVAVDPGRQPPEDAPRLGHDQGGGARRQPVEARRVGQHADGTRGERLGGEVGAVGARARAGRRTGHRGGCARCSARCRTRHVEVAVHGDVGLGAEPGGEVGGRRLGGASRTRRDGGLGCIHRSTPSRASSDGCDGKAEGRGGPPGPSSAWQRSQRARMWRAAGRPVNAGGHRPSVSTHHSTGRRDGVPLVGSTP